MAKSAKLVLTTFISRVIVDDNTADEQIAALAKSKIQEKLNNDEVLENIEVILPDDECPYGTFEDEKECPVCGSHNIYTDQTDVYCCRYCGSDFNGAGNILLNGDRNFGCEISFYNHGL